MPKKARELSAIEVKRLTRPGLHAVGEVAGLMLQVSDTGARSWILRATVGTKRRDIGLGGFPDVTLAGARERARTLRDSIRHGVDPVEERRAARARLELQQQRLVTFEEAATAYHATQSAGFRSAKHAQDWINSLSSHAFPIIGHVPIGQIDMNHVLKVLEPIWREKTETASRVRQRIEKVLDYGKAKKYREGDNPAAWAGNLDSQLPAPSKVAKVKHHRAISVADMPGFMKALRQQAGVAPLALDFAILTAARSNEVRGAVWSEIDLKGRLWTIPAERMKSGKAHRVPLSTAAVKLLERAPRLGDYVFTAPRGGKLSDMTLLAVTRRMKVDATPHGFRSTFKDWARTKTRHPDEWSELALAHVNSDATRAAYARDELVKERAQLMEDWAKFCGGAK